jgi:DNA-binding MarR family transcriptional regulator
MSQNTRIARAIALEAGPNGDQYGADAEITGKSTPKRATRDRNGAARARPVVKSTASEGLANSGDRDDVSIGPLADYIGFHLRLAQDASFRGIAQRFARRNLKPGHFAALLVIHNNPSVSQSALGRAISRDKSTITPLLQGLERLGYITRRAQKSDGRGIELNLTPAGEVTLRLLLAHAKEHELRLDDILGDNKTNFLEMLKRVVQELSWR